MFLVPCEGLQKLCYQALGWPFASAWRWSPRRSGPWGSVLPVDCCASKGWAPSWAENNHFAPLVEGVVSLQDSDKCIATTMKKWGPPTHGGEEGAPGSISKCCRSYSLDVSSPWGKATWWQEPRYLVKKRFSNLMEKWENGS